MHAYATDSPDKRYIPFVLAGAAIAGTFWASRFLASSNVSFPWWLSSPFDTMVLYGLFHLAFDRWIWRLHLLHRLRIVRAPYLGGSWSGEARTAASIGNGTPLGTANLTVEIKQTWSQISIVGTTTHSQFRSLSASLITADECSISYEYRNEPRAGAPPTMNAHRGTAMLDIDTTRASLGGEYYAGRGRQTIGTLELHRVTAGRVERG